MINPNGEGFNQPLPGSEPMGGGAEFPTGTPVTTATPAPTSARRVEAEHGGFSSKASGAWRQTKLSAGQAREKTEFILRENPVPTVIGALAVGLAIGLAIRYSADRETKHEAKTPLGDINLGVLSLPFLWPFFKQVKKSARRTYEDSADAVRDGVDRIRHVDVDRYTKPLRKKWKSWRN